MCFHFFRNPFAAGRMTLKWCMILYDQGVGPLYFYAWLCGENAVERTLLTHIEDTRTRAALFSFSVSQQRLMKWRHLQCVYTPYLVLQIRDVKGHIYSRKATITNSEQTKFWDPT